MRYETEKIISQTFSYEAGMGPSKEENISERKKRKYEHESKTTGRRGANLMQAGEETQGEGLSKNHRLLLKSPCRGGIWRGEGELRTRSTL